MYRMATIGSLRIYWGVGWHGSEGGMMSRQSGREGYLPRPQMDSRTPAGTTRGWDRVLVLANRAPYRYEHAPDGRVSLTRSASGLVTALEPLVDACAGVWVAHGTDVPDQLPPAGHHGTNVPRANVRYRLKYVHLDAEEHRGFYYGFSNEALWPLCHSVHVAPVFRTADFRHYESANARFVDAVVQEAQPGSSLVLVQDYHFALAARRLRKLLPSSTVVAFWHVPWPHLRVFRTCPWHRELLDGMLGSDIAGFQTDDDASNFMECVRSLLHAEVDAVRRVVTYRRHETRVRVYPVGVEWDNATLRGLPSPKASRARVLRDLDMCDDVWLGVGVDRLDYTKGLIEKFLAIERALELYPALRGRLAFVQVAEPSRESLAAYQHTRRELLETTARINSRFGTLSYTPLRLLQMHHDAAEVHRLYRAADVCYVGSLHDGMNLVAKEFVSARADERGVLILSEFAGAARQLRTALTINPYAIDDAAAAIAKAFTMSDAEQCARMRLLRANVRAYDAGWWANQILSDAAEVRTQPIAVPEPVTAVSFSASGSGAVTQPAFAG